MTPLKSERKKGLVEKNLRPQTSLRSPRHAQEETLTKVAHWKSPVPGETSTIINDWQAAEWGEA